MKFYTAVAIAILSVLATSMVTVDATRTTTMVIVNAALTITKDKSTQDDGGGWKWRKTRHQS
jgi:hypothetical protein